MVQTSSWLYQSLCYGCRPPSRPVLGIAIRNEPFGSFWDDNLGSILRNVHMQIQQIQQIQILSNSDALPGPNISTFSKSGNFPGQTDSGIVHLSRSSASWQGMPGGSRKDLRVKSSPRVKCKWLKYIYIYIFLFMIISIKHASQVWSHLFVVCECLWEVKNICPIPSCSPKKLV